MSLVEILSNDLDFDSIAETVRSAETDSQVCEKSIEALQLLIETKKLTSPKGIRLLRFLSDSVLKSFTQKSENVSGLLKKSQFYDLILRKLDVVIKEEERLVSQLAKNKVKFFPLIEVLRLEERLESVVMLDEQIKTEGEKTFSTAQKIEKDYCEEAKDIFEDLSWLNERIISLNEEVLLRLDHYLQTHSKLSYYHSKMLEEQQVNLKKSECELRNRSEELERNSDLLKKAEREESSHFAVKLANLCFLSFLLGFIFAFSFVKKIPHLLINYRYF